MTVADPASTPVEIRRAQRADILEVYRLERECFASPWPYQAFVDHLEAPAFLVATIEDRLAGYLVADVTPSRYGHLKDLAVAPAFRRRGVASRLLTAGLAQLAVAGAMRVSLEVRNDNEAARSLYRQFEFVDDRVEPGYYADGTDAVIMSRSLP